MTNFNFLKSDPQFASFADAAIAAERTYNVYPVLSVLGCRQAMETAVKWMYSADNSLKMPYEDKLVSLLNTTAFKEIVDKDLYNRLEYIRRIGNEAAHNPKYITKDKAKLALKNLHIFMDFIAYCYGAEYTEAKFNEAILDIEYRAEIPAATIETPTMEYLAKANSSFKGVFTERRAAQQPAYTPKPIDFTEAATRKAYIDVMLSDAGWVEGENWLNEYQIDEMPNQSGVGFADYVLLGDDGRPLAVVEAKKASVDVSAGRQQAKLYADFLEKKFGRRPVIFLTNGFETRIICGKYSERKVSGVFGKRDLEKEFNIMSMRTKLDNIRINDAITNRYYQKEAIKAICEAFSAKSRRKVLLVMATGSGKTRTVISLADVLIQNGWVKNLLFLADRNSLVTQAKRAFANLLPDLSITNLVEDKSNAGARAVFSTYQTMMGCIDDTRDEDGKKLFTPGHFDLIVVDEAHRSIYNKYKDIFTYFDALLVGLTATPKDEIDKNTYGIFELEAGVPTYGYELAQAVEDGYLVSFSTIETKLKFMHDGIVYDELSDEDKEMYEELFADEDGEIPTAIDSSALNEWIFNKDTIRQALNTLMRDGLKVDYGNKIGKTIIFAKSHLHAEKILEVWNEQYSHYASGFCAVIDNYINYAQSIIDDFSDKSKLPQIAISVDMLDTGIDIPEILNLVFFKKVMSKAKFWQMIGRGTRLCEGLLDGENKKEFYIFDFCSNFEFFRVTNGKGKDAMPVVSLSERLFNLKTELIYKLQDLVYQTDELIAFRAGLIDELAQKITTLNRDNFAVRQHLRYVDTYSNKDNFKVLTYENTLQIAEHLAPFIAPDSDEISAVRFDALMYQLELLLVLGKSSTRAKNDLLKKTSALTNYGTIPEVKEQSEFINTLLNTDYIERAGIPELEHIRMNLRNLIKYIEWEPQARYDTDFSDSIISTAHNPSDLKNDDLVNYRKKVDYYIRTNENNPAIMKLKTNIPPTGDDIKRLESILWSELGSKQDYINEYGEKPLGALIRSIVGLDMMAANDAFSEYLNNENLDSRQIHFVKQIINYIVKNGMMTDFSVLQGSPFNDSGSVVEIFTDMSVWIGIKAVIEKINQNTMAA
ncbi:MAG: DEAD/DEAH box helicase family protein [Oscillospiraceae bacterium]|nr:DEAD/DEAH box helicase family protein [Oscillospiraceae bacterium]